MSSGRNLFRLGIFFVLFAVFIGFLFFSFRREQAASSELERLRVSIGDIQREMSSLDSADVVIPSPASSLELLKPFAEHFQKSLAEQTASRISEQLRNDFLNFNSTTNVNSSHFIDLVACRIVSRVKQVASDDVTQKISQYTLPVEPLLSQNLQPQNFSVKKIETKKIEIQAALFW